MENMEEHPRKMTSQVVRICAVISTIILASGASGADIDTMIMARIKPNVVVLEVTRLDKGPSRQGFGFIIGQRSDTTYLVTARHVIVGEPGGDRDSIFVRFSTSTSPRVAVLVGISKDRDLAVIKSVPDGVHLYNTNCLGLRDDALPGAPVSYIGEEGEIRIHRNIARIEDVIDVGNKILVGGMEVFPGTSGAPLIGAHGIIGIIVTDKPTKVEALSISSIHELAKSLKCPWDICEYKHIYRSGIFSGVRVGLGIVNYGNGGSDYGHRVVHGYDIGVNIGYVLREWLTLGFESNTYYKKEASGLIFRHDCYAVVFSGYPTDHVFARLGAVWAHVKAEPIAMIKTEDGPGFLTGLGFEFPVGRHLVIQSVLDFNYHRPSKIDMYNTSLVMNFTWFWQGLKFW